MSAQAENVKRLTYTVPEAANLLGIHQKTLYRMIRTGEIDLSVVRVGRRLLVPRATLHKQFGDVEGDR